MLVRMTVAFCFSVALLIAGGSAAQQRGAELTLPAMAPCTDSSHPLLPEKWQGTFLMAPFTRAQLILAELVYDSSIPAMRVRLFGLRQGSTDLLIKGREAFLLTGDEGPSASCLNLGDTGLRPPSRDWLVREARCEGSAPVAGVALDWWKTPSAAAPSADYIWFKTLDRSPFRMMFTQPADKPAVLGWYAFSYQVASKPSPAPASRPRPPPAIRSAALRVGPAGRLSGISLLPWKAHRPGAMQTSRV